MKATPWIAFASPCAAWVAILACVFFPGEASTDFIAQYEEATRGHVTNLQPPALTVLAGLSASTLSSSGLVLLLQLPLYFGLATLLAVRTRNDAIGLSLLCGFLLLPPSWAMAVAVWKDTWCDIALLACALALTTASWRRAAWLLLGGVLLALTRLNALLLAAPLAAYGFLTVPARLRVRAFLALAGVGLVVAAPGAIDRVVGASDEWPLGYIVVYDLAGIVVRQPEAFATTILREHTTLDALGRAYNPWYGWKIFGPRQGIPGLRAGDFKAWRDRGPAEWRRLVANYPRAYVDHRWSVYVRLLGIGSDRRMLPFPGPHVDSPFPGPDRESSAYRVLDGARRATFFRTPLLTGWLWGLVLIALLVRALVVRRTEAAVLLASVGVYIGAYVVVAPSAEFRYCQPMVVACFAAACLLSAPATGRLEDGRGRPEAAGTSPL